MNTEKQKSECENPGRGKKYVIVFTREYTGYDEMNAAVTLHHGM